jgi:glutathione S-transferase
VVARVDIFRQLFSADFLRHHHHRHPTAVCLAGIMATPQRYEIDLIPGSASERIVWLSHEVDFDSKLVQGPRSIPHPSISLPFVEPGGEGSLPSPQPLHPAIDPRPCIRDLQAGVELTGLGAIIYLYRMSGYGDSTRFLIPSASPDFANFIYWLHWVQDSFEPTIRAAIRARLDAGVEADVVAEGIAWVEGHLSAIELWLSENFWLAGRKMTLADIMMVHPLTTLRHLYNCNLADILMPRYPSTYEYLQQIRYRVAFIWAMKDCQTDVDTVLGRPPPSSTGSTALESGPLGVSQGAEGTGGISGGVSQAAEFAEGLQRLSGGFEGISGGVSRAVEFVEGLRGILGDFEEIPGDFEGISGGASQATEYADDKVLDEHQYI